jgi:hypothetical protein
MGINLSQFKKELKQGNTFADLLLKWYEMKIYIIIYYNILQTSNILSLRRNVYGDTYTFNWSGEPAIFTANKEAIKVLK